MEKRAVNIRPLRTDADYEAALDEINLLADAEPGTEAFDRLDILATLVEAYEAKTCPIGPPDPIDAVLFAMERLNLSAQDLEPYIGNGNGQVDAILNRQKPLTLEQMRCLSPVLGVSLAILVQEYPLVKSAIAKKPQAKKPQNVHVVKHADRWTITKDGDNRTSDTVKTEKETVTIAREVSNREKTS